MRYMVIKYALLILLAGLLALPAVAQTDAELHRCGFSQYSWYANQPKDASKFEQWLRRKMQQPLPMPQADSVIYIPVVVHVVHQGEPIGTGTNISDQAILAQIDILNQDFRRTPGTRGHNNHPDGADAKIEFALAQYDPNYAPTNGIVRLQGPQTTYSIQDRPTLANLSRWPATDYLNIWVCNLTTYLGYAEFPVADLQGLDGLSNTNPLIDGFVVNYKYFGPNPNSQRFGLGRTATHEIGHWLGLLHTWGDRTNCTGNDYCDDTPTSASPCYNCPIALNSCTNSPPDQTQNYLTYNDDGCMSVFTNDQVARMRTVLLNSPRRASLLNSHALTNTVPNRQMGFTLMPNPAHNRVVISFDTDATAHQLMVYAANGQLFKQYPLQSAQPLYLSTAQWPRGLYILALHTNKHTYRQKLLIQ